MLRVEGVDAYYGQSHALQSVSLTVGPGEAVALLGRNGAGKTTTLKTIMAVVRARRGQITWNGDDVTKLPPYRIVQAGIGYVPEERASEGYPCTSCGTFICLICSFRGVTLCADCQQHGANA